MKKTVKTFSLQVKVSCLWKPDFVFFIGHDAGCLPLPALMQKESGFSGHAAVRESRESARPRDL